jgi:REP element-mobilizing transposase RayT
MAGLKHPPTLQGLRSSKDATRVANKTACTIVYTKRFCKKEGGAGVPQSLSAVYIHLVFSTKERRPFLRDETIRNSLHMCLGGISKRLRCAPIVTGGVEDHIHLLARLGRTITQAEWIKELKRVSNLWLKEKHSIQDFEWQGGYADFSVSASNLEMVRKYIANQDQHHRKMSFQDEIRTMLRRHEVEWDERYIRD